jgi:hypothetical protein
MDLKYRLTGFEKLNPGLCYLPQFVVLTPVGQLTSVCAPAGDVVDGTRGDVTPMAMKLKQDPHPWNPDTP